jgi:hypothetical protein
MQWTGSNAQRISEWLAAAGAFGRLSLSTGDDVLVLHKPEYRAECRAAVGDWVVCLPGLPGDAGEWITQPAAEFERAYEPEPDSVQQLRDIADHVIGFNSPNLADVLNELATLLEADMAPREHPLPDVVLARQDDIRRTVAFARSRPVASGVPALADALDRLSDAAGVSR